VRSRQKVKGWSKGIQYDMNDVSRDCKVILNETVSSAKIVSNFLSIDAFDSYTFTGESVEVCVKNTIPGTHGFPGSKHVSEFYSVFQILTPPRWFEYDNAEGLKYYCTSKGSVKIVTGCRSADDFTCLIDGVADPDNNRIKVDYCGNDVTDDFYVYDTVRGLHLCGCDEYKRAIRNSKVKDRRCPACLTYHCIVCTKTSNYDLSRCGVCDLYVNDYAPVHDNTFDISDDIVMPYKHDKSIKLRQLNRKCKIML
jgi:hypothetical protein